MPASRLPIIWAAFAAMTSLAVGAGPAWAAPPQIVRDTTPPGRVGRVARLSGSVSAHAADADRWSAATPNSPVTSGDAFWTEPNARADIQIGPNHVTLAAQTEFDFSVLDDHAVTASEPQGETFLMLRAVPGGDVYTVQTPRGAVQIATAGRYVIAAGDAGHPTVVTVVEGAAEITGPALSLRVGPRQTATITGSDPLEGTVGPMAEDAFLTAMLTGDQPTVRQGAAIPPMVTAPIVTAMTGSDDLRTTGDWAETPEYGAVWYPPVQSGWVPYRDGRWSYVRPWGWTWVDQAPWGFAPFHYGRWAEIEHRWGWIPFVRGAEGNPGPGFRGPVYAPALVGFISFGLADAGRIGWVPLGPREAYLPPYRTSPVYLRAINMGVVQNVTQTNVVNRTTIVQTYLNRGAATVVPAAAMVRSQPIAGEARPLSADQLAGAHAQLGAPVRPTAATSGVTPVVARQFNFMPLARPAEAAAGPALRVAARQPPIPEARQPSPANRLAEAAPDPRPLVRTPSPVQPFTAAKVEREPPGRPAPRLTPVPTRPFEPRPPAIPRSLPQPRPAPMAIRPAPQPVFRPPPRPAPPAVHPQPRLAPPHSGPAPPHGAAAPHRR